MTPEMKKFHDSSRIDQIGIFYDQSTAESLPDDLLSEAGLTAEQGAVALMCARETCAAWPLNRACLDALALATAQQTDEPLQPVVYYEDAWKYVKAHPDLTLDSCPPVVLDWLSSGHLSQVLLLSMQSLYLLRNFAAGDDELFEKLEALYGALCLYFAEDKFGIKPAWMPYYAEQKYSTAKPQPDLWERLFGDELIMTDDERAAMVAAEKAVAELLGK